VRVVEGGEGGEDGKKKERMERMGRRWSLLYYLHCTHYMCTMLQCPL
jgi:hypothetical protein